MALIKKIIFSLLLLFLSLQSIQANKAQQTFKKAKSAFSKNRYSVSLKILQSHFDLQSNTAPSGALILGAWNYHHLGDYYESQKIWAHIIRKKYRRMNKKVVASYNKNKSVDFLPDDIPEKLLEYYFERYKNMIEYMIKRYDLLSEVTSKNLYDALIMYKEILIEQEVNEDEVEKLWEKLENYKVEREKVIYKNNYYLYTGLLSYKDSLKIKTPSGAEYDISSSSQGWCLGLGRQYENAFIRYAIEGCFGNQTTTVGTDSDEINYFQKNVPSVTFLVTPKVSWRTPSQNSYIGVGLPLFYRKGDFTEPTGFEITEKSLVTYGLTVHGQWQIQKYALFFQFGKISKFSSSLWMAGFHYHFK
tara:strand:- start:406660 stop:407739 length:1080 start_codon:yes stop_codon:yes gene_type:complete